MSTMPRDSREVTDAAGHAPVFPAARQERNFDEAIRDFISMADELGIERPSDDELRDLCRQVAKVSLNLFPGDLVIKIIRDPEIRDDIYFEFNVRPTGSSDEIANRIWQWSIDLRRAVEKQADWFSLSFDVP